MDRLTPTNPDTSEIHVTRDPRPDGGAVYTITVDVNSEAVIAAGAELEGVSAGYLVASSVHIRLAVLASALDAWDASCPPSMAN